MKEFALLNTYYGIFDKHLYPRFEALMEDHLDITRDEKAKIVEDAILEYFTPNMMAEHLNYALRMDYDPYRYKYIDGQAYLVEYKPSPYRFKVNTHFIKHPTEDADIVKVTEIPNEHFKDLFVTFAWEWFYSRTDGIMRQIIFSKCNKVNEEKDAGVMKNYNRIICGSYQELVETYEYLLSL